jgi:hypothetical protein
MIFLTFDLHPLIRFFRIRNRIAQPTGRRQLGTSRAPSESVRSRTCGRQATQLRSSPVQLYVGTPFRLSHKPGLTLGTHEMQPVDECLTFGVALIAEEQVKVELQKTQKKTQNK